MQVELNALQHICQTVGIQLAGFIPLLHVRETGYDDTRYLACAATAEYPQPQLVDHG